MGRAFNVYVADELVVLIEAHREAGRKVNLSAILRRGLVEEFDLERRCEHATMECGRCGATVDRRADVEAPLATELGHRIYHLLYGEDWLLVSRDAYAVVRDLWERRGFPLPEPWDWRPLRRRALAPTSNAAWVIAEERQAAVRDHVDRERAAVEQLPTPEEIEAGRAAARRRHPTARATRPATTVAPEEAA